MTDTDDTLRRYLAEHDVPCPACGYNLRGLDGEACPECGGALALRAYPDAERLDDAARTALYLRDHDVVCRRCRVTLRGTDGVCPGCGRRYVARGLPRLEGLARDTGARVWMVAMWAVIVVPVLIVAALALAVALRP